MELVQNGNCEVSLINFSGKTWINFYSPETPFVSDVCRCLKTQCRYNHFHAENKNRAVASVITNYIIAP